MSAQLDEKTIKLLVLALDPEAEPGEVDNAACALVRRLCNRYQDGYPFLNELTGQPEQIGLLEPSTRYGETRMTFGRHKGERLRNIDPSYLMWALNNCENMDPYLRIAIRRYLK
jgi:hypothetical protein